MDGDGDLGPAGLLALRHGLTIVTNSAQITPLLADSDNTVYALGGQVCATSLACVGMWTLTALRTLREHDATGAHAVIEADDAIDALYRAGAARAAACIREDPAGANAYLAALSVFRALERLGDVATNIAEDVIYLETAELVRHG